MVTGFAVVLYSRLNLILESRITRRTVLYMIIAKGLVFYVILIMVEVGNRALGGAAGEHESTPS